MKIMALAALLAATPAAATDRPQLLPSPAAMQERGPGFELAATTPIVARDAGARNAATRLAELMARSGVQLGAPVAASNAAQTVRFVRQAGLAPEAYRLVSGPSGATITATDDAGMLYGAVTLWQLATQDRDRQVDGVAIDDHPRFGWRGLMLDSARHFQSPAYIHRLIDAMLASKLNRLHWHLVDDQGWRLPVPGYPKLTEISAWRRGATAAGAPPLPVEGGFYTAEQIREIVGYAAARGITIVPEVEMPGHALAAIRAYPALGMGVAIPAGTESDYGVFPWLYNTKPETFRFLEAVLGEVMALFPSRDVHIGGDEAVKDQWKADPAVQAQIKMLGLKDEDALQGWFMARIATFLQAHGRRAIGWDEVLDGGVPTDVAITSWRGIDGAVKAARGGHDAILSPAPTLYFNNRQGTGAEEPPSHGALVTLADVLAFDPAPPGLAAEQLRHIVGVQANLWTEHVRTEERAAWMTFPRAEAIAEIGWAPAGKRDIAAFEAQLAPQIGRLASLGIVAADSASAVLARLDAGQHTIAVTLATQSGLPIRYTRDGGAPSVQSSLYAAPLALRPGERLRAASFLGDRPLTGGYDARVSRAAAMTRTSRDLTLCTSKVPLDLEDDFPAKGPRAHFFLDIFNPCWRWDDAPVAQARAVAIEVGQIPFNFQVGKDRDNIRFAAPTSADGEFEVRSGGCEGPVIATLPLAPAAARPGVTRLSARLPRRAVQTGLCFTYTAHGVEPLWAINRVTLLP